jgi:hypothetical protein
MKKIIIIEAYKLKLPFKTELRNHNDAILKKYGFHSSPFIWSIILS